MPIDTGSAAIGAGADTAANPAAAPQQIAFNERWNGTSWDRERNNVSQQQQVSAAITTTANGTDQTNHNALGVIVTVNVSAASGTTPTHDMKLQYKSSGGFYVDIPGAVLPQATGVLLRSIAIAPGITPAAGTAVAFNMPRVWRWVETIGGTTPSFTRTIDVEYLV